MKIRIKNCQRKITISKTKISGLAKQVLNLKGVKKAELSILFVGKARICALNQKFRGIKQPTDVLAFSMREGKDSQLHPELLGDLVIYPEIAAQRAKDYSTSLRFELYLYLVHGILHLLGYDDTQPKKYQAMKKEQQRILTKLNLRG
ncbi:rRNA maturation RNase YbeY [Candidatus Omnitrophota bacterium]